MQRVRLVLSVTALLVCAIGAGAPIPSSSQAQTSAPAGPSGQAIDYHAESRTLTVHLNGLPLRQVMEALSKQTHIRFRPPPPVQEFDSRPVTASFNRMPIERAIKQLLGPSNTAMLYGTVQQTGGTTPRLLEVRVLDLGVVPVVATNDEPAPPPVMRLTPDQIQARREEMLKRREERQARRNARGGRGFGGFFRGPTDQSSGQPAENGGEKGSKPSEGVQPSNGGQQSGDGSKSNGNGGGKP
jgi:hypothetical protein